MLEPRRASQAQDESHTTPTLGKGRAGCVVPGIIPGRTLAQHSPVSNGGVFYCLLSAVTKITDQVDLSQRFQQQVGSWCMDRRIKLRTTNHTLLNDDSHI